MLYTSTEPQSWHARGTDSRFPQWWQCNGSGWVAGVPGCGGQGSWHVCASTDEGCAETSSTNTRMACR